MTRQSLILLLSLLGCVATIQAQAQQEDYTNSTSTCGSYDLADALDNTDFDTVEASTKCSWSDHLLGPKTIHWHIYEIEDDQEPRISMTPEGLVKPRVRGDSLKFDMEDILTDFSQGDKLEAGINLYISSSQMRNIVISGVEETVEIIRTSSDSLSVKDSGVDNNVYVSSPNSKVYYKGSGVDSMAQIKSGSGSSVTLSGVDQTVSIKTEGDDLEVRMSGVDQTIRIDGDYSSIKMSGIDAKALVNNGSSTSSSRCARIDNSGISSSCSLSDDLTVVVDEVSCLALTKVVKGRCSSWNPTVGAIAGASIGGLALICCCLGLCTFGCIRCCCFQKSSAKQYPPVATATENPKLAAGDAASVVVEGEVIKVEMMSDTSMYEEQDHPLAGATKVSHQDDLIAAETGLGSFQNKSDNSK